MGNDFIFTITRFAFVADMKLYKEQGGTFQHQMNSNSVLILVELNS